MQVPAAGLLLARYGASPEPRSPGPRPGRPWSGSGWFTPVLLLLATASWGCEAPDRSGRAGSPSAAAGIEAAGSGAPTPADRRARFLVTPEALAGELQGSNPPVVLEVGNGDQAFREEGRVEGARFLPWEAVALRRDEVPNQIPPLASLAEALAAAGVGPEDRIVLYDRGAGLQAGRAWAVLDYVGLGDRTRLLDGQWAGWLASSGPIANGEFEATPSETPPILRPHPERVIAGERVADLVWARSEGNEGRGLPPLLDARPPAEFSGEDPGDEVGRPGHIPGALNLFWRSMAGPDENPAFLELEALQARFEEAGARPGGPVLTYCRTGGQAGHLYFVARMLGYEPQLYDGSFVEWSRHPDRPVVVP
jgi:thiosulfate/3-mercaptopyruvate sulfurtransferase